MDITFEKWHGNGNDFVIVNSIDNEIKIKKSFVKKISNMPALALSGVGVLISIRHIYFQTGGGGSGACSVGIPCSLKYVEIFNFISIPSMAFTAFLTIFLSILYYELLQKVKDE